LSYGAAYLVPNNFQWIVQNFYPRQSHINCAFEEAYLGQTPHK
jgi:hypothetical protein